ncbi:MAG TPA: hypothetical protein ENH29_09515 [Bacteroidetes bacterium]|nr:hypothetical protein [Bacteroidota bacterium]
MPEQKRELEDRRKKPTRPISRYSFIGRRKKNRREVEKKNYYVDRYEPGILFIFITVLIFCALDALLTLKLLQYGGIELNPFMAVLIRKDSVLFFIVKIAITAVNTLILLLHKNFVVFGWFKFRTVIYSVFLLYFGLIVYELHLFLKYVF